MNELVEGFPIPPPNSRLEAEYVEAHRRRKNERNDVKHREDKQNRSSHYAICNVVDDCRGNNFFKIAFLVNHSPHRADPNCISRNESTPKRRQKIVQLELLGAVERNGTKPKKIVVCFRKINLKTRRFENNFPYKLIICKGSQ